MGFACKMGRYISVQIQSIVCIQRLEADAEDCEEIRIKVRTDLEDLAPRAAPASPDTPDPVTSRIRR